MSFWKQWKNEFEGGKIWRKIKNNRKDSLTEKIEPRCREKFIGKFGYQNIYVGGKIFFGKKTLNVCSPFSGETYLIK